MDPSRAGEIDALKRLLEECRCKAVDLQIADVAYILLMAETTIVEHLGHLKDDGSQDHSASASESPKGLRH